MQTRNSMESIDINQGSPETKAISPGTAGNRAEEALGKSEVQAPAKVLYLRASEFLNEETFRELLFFERKRAERSKEKLSLLLLDVSGIIDTSVRHAVLRRLAKTLTVLNTEIALSGWYKDDVILGAIVRGQPDLKKEALQDRILSTLGPPLIDQGRHLKVSVCSFPGEARGNAAPEADASLFYPDSAAGEKGRRLALFIKRAMDIAGGIAGMLLFAPFFMALPIIIKASSKGPVLFRQERIGRHGKKFVFLKFRTMYADNDPKIHQEYIKDFIREKKSYDTGGNGEVYKIKDDPRVTPVGRFLRKTSLDELPQFFNVLTGEMSLVGPRPPIPYELENYDFWHLRRVMEIKPGITGLWQVEGRSSTTFDEMVRLDLKYAREWSAWLDIRILLKTPWAALAGKGAY